ncbi:SIMPL domain-containing protein [Fulvivirga lutea]|uniref:SIMPL domain-containing protein n=1 Tax=Fulvivirga lutea TaxID=2810512 RepID=A0A975A022_9BACT|nr:SIMPL domain-containing protein [Fulvivirga lutea]QSE96924.1 SIMPL domain-containing protein [Fulvivirga lutea]
MKSKLLLIALILVTTVVQAQVESRVKKIEVNGKAEMEVIPDEIYLQIALKEYKSGLKKVDINTLEAGLVKAVKQLNLGENNLTVDNIYGYNWDWKKRKSDEFLATKSFKLKVNNLKMLNDLIEKLDADGVNSINIAEVSHSRIDEYRRELKIKALQAAKAKATALLASIDEEIGGALEIQEVGQYDAPMYARNTMMMEAKMDGGYQSDLEYKNITISSEIRAVFEIR